MPSITALPLPALRRSQHSHNTHYAERRGSYSHVYSQLDSSGVTTFYDSVCGIPLFRAPVGRSFAEWQAESVNHGWPSFRKEETFTENVIILSSGEMRSMCDVHLGHNLPDSRGDRYCECGWDEETRRTPGRRCWRRPGGVAAASVGRVPYCDTTIQKF